MEPGCPELKESQMLCPEHRIQDRTFRGSGLTGSNLWRVQGDTTWTNPSFQDAERYLHCNEGVELSSPTASVPPRYVGNELEAS